VAEDDGMKFHKDIYPFDAAPRFTVSGSEVRENLSKVFLTDTTLRDGQQGWRVFTVEECEKIYELLADIGGRGAIAASEVFLYTERDREVARRLLSYGYQYPKVVAWIRATHSDLQLVKDARIDEAIILMSISDYHIRYKFNATREEVFRKYLDVAEKALSCGIAVRASLEDVTRADVFGAVIPFISRLLKLGEKYGVPVKIRLPDTLGLGLPFSEAPLPRGIPALVQAIRRATGIPQEHIEFHGHNDFGLVVANHLAAWMHGAAAANCTLLGIGERAGNCPLEVMALHYAGIVGASKINLRAISRIPETFEKMGFQIPDHQPLVGRNAFRTKAGIHADGLLKNPEVYLPFNTLRVIGLPYTVAITPYSGRAAIVLWLKNYLGYDHATKEDPRVEAVYNEILEMFNRTGRSEPLTDHEMLTIARKYFKEISAVAQSHINLG
jgi:isopropylmalate/homocitrate/citramalate synthase